MGNSKATQLPKIPGRFIADNQEIQAYYFKMEQIKNLHPLYTKPKQSHPIETAQTPPPEIVEQVNKPLADKNGLDLDF